MATLTGTQIANTYKQLLQVGSGNNGLTASVQNVQDGQGNNSPLQLSQSAVNIDGTFQLNGVTLTANASALNDIADLTGATGIIAVSGGNVYGRTLTGGTGVSITNADGTEGNPTIALNPTGVVSASYGPATNIEINSVGQVVSAGAVTSVSVSGVTANTFTGGTFAGTTGDFSSNVSVGGNLVIAGQFSPASLSVTGTINATKISATDATFNNNVSVGGNLVIAGQFSPAALSVTGTVNAANISATDATFNNNVSVGGNLVVTGQLSPAALSVTGTVNATKISATNATFNSVVSAGFFVGDGSGLINVPSVEGGTVKAITAGTGIKLTVDAAVTTTIPVSGTVAVSANQNFGSVSVSTALAVTGSALFGIVSATNIDTDELLIAGVSAATVTEVAAVSALTQINLDSITSINGIIEGNVSADSGTFNTLTVVTSASVGGTLNVGGNVGIGTTAPAVELEIASAQPELRLTDTDGTDQESTFIQAGGTLFLNLQNDTNNGAFRVRGFASGSPTDHFLVNGSGNVGIGTASPAVPLHISSATPSIRLTDTDDNSDAQIGAAAGGLLVFDADINNEVAGSAILFRVDGGSEKMRITSVGNVGIGNTAPSYLLDLYRSASTVARIRNSAATGGTPSTTHGEFVIESTDANMGMQFLGSTTANQRILFGDTDSGGSGQVIYDHTSNYMALSVAGAERMRITSTGNVGIGISSPATKFHVLDGTSSLRFRQNGTVAETLTVGPSGGDAAIYLGDIADTVRAGLYYDTSENDLQIRGYNNSTRILIDSAGNVGIGTTAPDGNLNVQRTAASAGWIINGQTVGVANDSGLFMDASNNIELAVRDGSGTLTGAVRSSGTTFFNGGNVGINTTTTLGAKLFVSQGAAASPATSGNMTTVKCRH
jgi:hypothetical protein